MEKVFDILHPETKIEGPHFLQASAGTGKTFSMEHLAVRLIIEKKIDISEILVVTFTKEAARDIKQRIYANIQNAFSSLRESSFSPPFSYLKKYESHKDESLRSLHQALSLFDQAQICTIHSFCLSLLQEFYFFASLSMENNVTLFALKKKCKGEIFSFLTSSSLLSIKQKKVLLNTFSDLDVLLEKILKNLTNQREMIEPLSFEKQYCQFLEILKKFPFTFSKQEIHSLLTDSLKQFLKISKYSQEDVLEEIDLLSTLLEKKECTIKEFDRLLASPLSLGEIFSEKNRKKKCAIAPEAEKLLSCLQSSIYAYLQKMTNPSFLVEQLSIFLSEKMQEIIEGNFSFPDEILQKVQKSLKNEQFLEKVRSRYKAVIVDEFQDTDIRQWDIFSTLFLSNSFLVAFYLVGDPKQSIYRFRQSDLYTYFLAQKQMGQEARYYLQTNYRSEVSLLEAINILFQKASPLYLPKEGRKLPYIPSFAGKSSSSQKDKAPLQFFVIQEDLEGSFSDVEEKIWHSYICREIARLIEEINPPLEQIAILVKDRFSAKSMHSSLEKALIPSFVQSHQDVAESYAFEALKALTDCMMRPQEKDLLRFCLQTPFFGVHWQELLHSEAQLMAEAARLIAHLSQILTTQGWSHFWGHFYSSLFQRKSIFQNIIASDFSFFEDLTQIRSLFLELDHTIPLGEGFISASFAQVEMIDLEQRKKRSFEKTGVQIMTMHKSKGLEFDFVFALGLSFPSSTTEQKEADEEKNELDAEKLRHLYVALTRAKKRVYIPLSYRPGVMATSPLDLFLHDFLQESPFTKDALQNAFNPYMEKGLVFFENVQQESILPVKREMSSTPLVEPTIPIFSKIKQTVHSFSSLVEKGEEKIFISSTSSEGQKALLEQAIPLGAETGVLLHKIFETIFFKKEKTCFQKESYQLVASKVVKNTFLDSCKGEIFAMLERVFSAPFFDGDKYFTLSDLDPRNIDTEIEFLFPINSDANDFVKGFIDLLFFHKGKYYLLDWKSNYLGKDPCFYEKEYLKDYIEEREYSLQASLYAHAVKRFALQKENQKFEEIFGGIFFVFLRGVDLQGRGIYHFLPPIEETIKPIHGDEND